MRMELKSCLIQYQEKKPDVEFPKHQEGEK